MEVFSTLSELEPGHAETQYTWKLKDDGIQFGDSYPLAGILSHLE